jgi:hypothetical protein
MYCNLAVISAQDNNCVKGSGIILQRKYESFLDISYVQRDLFFRKYLITIKDTPELSNIVSLFENKVITTHLFIKAYQKIDNTFRLKEQFSKFMCTSLITNTRIFVRIIGVSYLEDVQSNTTTIVIVSNINCNPGGNFIYELILDGINVDLNEVRKRDVQCFRFRSVQL